jgi:hypothetical protein
MLRDASDGDAQAERHREERRPIVTPARHRSGHPRITSPNTTSSACRQLGITTDFLINRTSWTAELRAAENDVKSLAQRLAEAEMRAEGRGTEAGYTASRRAIQDRLTRLGIAYQAEGDPTRRRTAHFSNIRLNCWRAIVKSGR